MHLPTRKRSSFWKFCILLALEVEPVFKLLVTIQIANSELLTSITYSITVFRFSWGKKSHRESKHFYTEKPEKHRVNIATCSSFFTKTTQTITAPLFSLSSGILLSEFRKSSGEKLSNHPKYQPYSFTLCNQNIYDHQESTKNQSVLPPIHQK